MDVIFKPHNPHWANPDQFAALDPHLSALAELPLVYRFPLLDRLPRTIPGVYSITGGRQVGKTTLLKRHMADLLDVGVDPMRIVYVPGEMVDDHHALARLFTSHLESLPLGPEAMTFILDEVTYVKDWDRGVKFLADAGLLKNTIMILTGSDSVVIQDARMRFPGRRGKSDRVDFHLFPISFAEFVSLKEDLSLSDAQGLSDDPNSASRLDVLFETYLIHGGYLTGINDYETTNSIPRSTFMTYADWIRGDVLKRGKREHFLREILSAMVKRIGSQVTWNALSGELSIDHPATVSDYVELLARMDAAIIQLALREDKLTGAPKKARKLHFADPFVFHAVRSWLSGVDDPFERDVSSLLADAEKLGGLVESCAVSHFHRLYPTFYIKGQGEVDIAYVKEGRFHPIEIKWTRQIRKPELKQAAKYPNSLVCSRADAPSTIHGINCQPLAVTLLKLGASPIHLRDG